MNKESYFTEKELNNIFEDGFIYELNMVVFTLIRFMHYLNKPYRTIEEKQEQDVFLESFLIHTRVIIDFFRFNKNYPNNVYYTYYVGKGSVINLVDTEEELFRDLSTKLAHITRGRLQDNIKWWDRLEEIKNCILWLLKQFEKIIADSERKKLLSEKIKEIEIIEIKEKSFINSGATWPRY